MKDITLESVADFLRFLDEHGFSGFRIIRKNRFYTIRLFYAEGTGTVDIQGHSNLLKSLVNVVEYLIKGPP